MLDQFKNAQDSAVVVLEKYKTSSCREGEGNGSRKLPSDIYIKRDTVHCLCNLILSFHNPDDSAFLQPFLEAEGSYLITCIHGREKRTHRYTPSASIFSFSLMYGTLLSIDVHLLWICTCDLFRVRKLRNFVATTSPRETFTETLQILRNW